MIIDVKFRVPIMLYIIPLTLVMFRDSQVVEKTLSMFKNGMARFLKRH